jgi:L-ascorbate metabolism protein UlaG (beta-lactamase superfamily)
MTTLVRRMDCREVRNAGWQIEDAHTVIIVDPYVSQFHDTRLGKPNTSDDNDVVPVPD